MKNIFTSSAIKKIEKILSVKSTSKKNTTRFEIAKNSPFQVVLEIYSNIPIGKSIGNLISVYTRNTHLQLHHCSGFVVSEMLGEVTFISEHNEKVSGLIVEKKGGCSFYTNVERSLLSGDFTNLGPEVMLSGIALSLTETVLPTTPRKKKKQ